MVGRDGRGAPGANVEAIVLFFVQFIKYLPKTAIESKGIFILSLHLLVKDSKMKTYSSA